MNWYDMNLRMYDPALARWMVQDPVIHYTKSTYNAFDNNPVFFADPSGADAEGGETPDPKLAFGVPLSSVMRTSSLETTIQGKSISSNKNVAVEISDPDYKIEEKEFNTKKWSYINADSLEEANSKLGEKYSKSSLNSLLLITHGGYLRDDSGNVIEAGMVVDKVGNKIDLSNLNQNNPRVQTLITFMSFVKPGGNFILGTCFTGMSDDFGQKLHAFAGFQLNIFLNNDYSSFRTIPANNGMINRSVFGPITNINDLKNGWDYFKAGDEKSNVNSIRNITIKDSEKVQVKFK